MSEYLIMDVSGWNTNVPYSKLPSLGIKGGIFRITEKGNKTDSMFEKHWNGFTSNGYKTLGVYKYSYATTIAEIQEEAYYVIKALNGRECPLGVWLDLEDSSQTSISKNTMTAMIKAFREMIINAGYHFGIYSSKYWMQTYLDPSALPYDYWLAAYAYDGTLKESLRPNFGEKGWQYTSSYKIDGAGYDMSLFQSDYIDGLMNGVVEDTTETTEVEGNVEEDVETIDKNAEIVEKAIQWMEDLANDNSHGYDQIYRWGEKGDFDCSSAIITSWQTAGIPVKTNGATYTGNMYNVFVNLGFKDVTSSVNLSTGAGLVRGDILLNHVHHVAMYCGNGKEVEASINENGGARYGTPGDQTGREILIRSYRNYPWNVVLRWGNGSTGSSSSSSSSSSTLLKKGSTGDAVKDLQQKLVILGWSLDIDGDFGNLTLAAVKEFQTKYGLDVDGVVGPLTIKAINDAIGNLENVEEKPETDVVVSPGDSYEGVVVAYVLNVRQSPTTSSNIIGKVYIDNIITITKENNSFGYVPEKNGWVSLDYVKKVINAVCTGDEVRVRASGSLSGTVLGYAYKGDTIKVIGTKGSWTNVVVNGITGWMSSTYVK